MIDVLVFFVFVIEVGLGSKDQEVGLLDRGARGWQKMDD